MGKRRQIAPDYAAFVDSSHRAGAELQQVTLTWRGFLVGVLFSFCLATGAPSVAMLLKAHLAIDFNTPGAIFLFLLLIGPINLLLKLTGRNPARAWTLAAGVAAAWLWSHPPPAGLDPHSPGLIFSTSALLIALAHAMAVQRGLSLALNRADLVLVYGMLLIVSALCQMGLGEQLPGIISALFYYASPQNRWAERLFPHVPQRLVVDDGDGNRLFYEGTAGAAIPYASWAEPLIWWAVFLLALYVAMVSIAVILRRQWIDGERLSYPAAQVGLEMIRGEESGRLVNRFFRSPAMWIGWTVPMALSTLNGLKQFGITIPTPTTTWNLPFVGSQGLHLSVDFIAIGFSYLIHTHLAFGICFFNLLAKCEKAFMHAAGIKSSQTIIFGVHGFPLLGYQGTGALLAMVLVGLWIARGHLSDVWRKAIGRAPQIDDGDEIMSYRGAVCGAVCGVLVMAVWLWIMGTPAWISLLFVVVAMLVFIGLTRIVVEVGLVKLRAPMCAPDLVIQGLGSSLVGSAGVVNLSLAYVWAADVRVFVMGTCANALKLLEGMDRCSRRLIFWGIVSALFIGGVGSLWMVFHLTYKYGGVNMGSWFFNQGPETAYANAIRNLDPSGIYWEGLGFFAGGGVVMTLMMLARNRLSWWPIHPIGFPIGANHLTNEVWFSVFLAWAVKVCVLRLGGAAGYRQSVPFFLGLLTGQVTGQGLWLLVGYLAGATGRYV